MKRIFRFSVLLGLSLLLLLLSAAPAFALSDPETQASDFAVEFLKERALANLDKQEIDYEAYAVTADDVPEDALPLSMILDAQTKYMQEHFLDSGLGVSDVSVTHNVQSVSVDGNTAHLSVFETVGMRYAGSDEDSAVSTNYEIDLLKTSAGWKVSDISYDDHTAMYGFFIEQSGEIAAQALGLLKSCAEAEYAFGPLDFGTYAVNAADVLKRGKDIVSAAASPVPAFEAKKVGELPLAEYLWEKFAYIQHTRRAEDLAVSSLSTTYRFVDFSALPNREDGAQRASVSIFETAGMRYAALDQDSAVSKTYDLELIRTDAGWKVSALSSDDYRDGMYQDMLGKGGLQAAIAAYDGDAELGEGVSETLKSIERGVLVLFTFGREGASS